MLRIKQFFCKHDMNIEKRFEPNDIVLLPYVNCFYYICKKCKFVDKSQVGHAWSKYYRDECIQIGQLYTVKLKWKLEGEPPCAQ